MEHFGGTHLGGRPWGTTIGGPHLDDPLRTHLREFLWDRSTATAWRTQLGDPTWGTTFCGPPWGTALRDHTWGTMLGDLQWWNTMVDLRWRTAHGGTPEGKTCGTPFGNPTGEHHGGSNWGTHWGPDMINQLGGLLLEDPPGNRTWWTTGGPPCWIPPAGPLLGDHFGGPTLGDHMSPQGTHLDGPRRSPRLRKLLGTQLAVTFLRRPLGTPLGYYNTGPHMRLPIGNPSGGLFWGIQ